MKRLLFLIVVIFFSSLATGQESTDSLTAIWQDETQSTQLRLDALGELYSNHLNTKPDSALILAEKAFVLAKEYDLKKEMASVLHTMGVASLILSDFPQAIEFQLRSISISEPLADRQAVMKALNSIGNAYLKQSDYALAIDYYARSLEIAQELEDREREGLILGNIGLIYMDVGEYDQALINLSKALTIVEERSSKSTVANVLNNIGTIYRHQGNSREALAYYEKSLAITLNQNINYGLATCYSNIGLVYEQEGDKQKAHYYFNESLKWHKKLGDRKGMANCLIHLGNLYKLTHQDSAAALAEQALQLAQETGSNEEIRDAAKLLSVVYEAKKQYEMAYEMHKLFQETQAQLLNVNTLKAVLGNTYDQANEKQLQEQQTQYKYKIYAMCLAAFLLIIPTGVYFSKKLHAYSLEKNELLRQLEQLKKKQLTLSISAAKMSDKTISLDKAKIETAIDSKLGESSWLILNLLFEQPTISNKAIAQEVSLSVEGVSSSLRRMYSTFKVKASNNKKVALITEAVRISMEKE